MITDAHNRAIHYLRISLTDVCNLRCVYCMPENIRFRPGDLLMRDEEIVALASLFAELGFDKIRFTGGEPTLRRGLIDIIRAVAALPGVRSTGLTTNGLLLDQLARPLAEAGLRNVNVSLDTLDPERFRAVTRWGNLRDVLAGIDAAQKVGLRIKINAVIAKGINDSDDPIELARLTLSNDWQIRFIEMMPLGGLADFQWKHSVPAAQLREKISAALGPLQDELRFEGEARIYRLPNAKGTLGFINPVTQPFCGDCNRVRLTADGMLRLCLLHDQEIDLATPLRSGASPTDMKTLITKAISQKPWGHDLAQHQAPASRAMSEIGG